MKRSPDAGRARGSPCDSLQVLKVKPPHGLTAEVQSGSEFRLGPPRVFVAWPKDQRGVQPDHSDKRLLALLPAGNDPTPSITVLFDGLPGESGR